MDKLFKITFIFLILTCSTIKGDPCTSYQVLDSENDHSRSAANVDGSRCDDQLVTGWYRITSKAGERMPTECIIGGGRCGTTFSTWMSGSYPNTGEIANVTACAASYTGDCCKYSHDIQVKNCTDFLVYKLQPVVNCNQAYCFGTELPCPEGQTSDNGFSPGCHYDPCLEVNYKTLDQWQRSVKNTGVNGTICDNMLKPGWYRPISLAGNMMPTQCQEGGFTCGTINTLWMNGSHPAAGGISNVTACSSSYNGGCCITSYDMQVKNCGDFYIYNLQNTKGCYQAYCFGTELPCPEGQTSDNGFSPGCHYDPCLEVNYKTLDQWQRSVKNTGVNGTICDNMLKPGWYRPISLAGNMMPTQCQEGGFTCGTIDTLWMNGSHPAAGGISNVTACSSSYNGGCCITSYDMQVKNCGDFYIYNLQNTNGCYQAYCFGTEVPCPAGKTSDNGYTPGCEFDPCLSINYDILSGEARRSSAYALTKDDVAIEDSRLKPGWYRIDSVTGNDIVNFSVPMQQCGTVYPVWMKGHIPDIADKTVDRKVCRSTFNSTCDNEYDIKVRNCGSYRTYFLPQLNKEESAYCFGTLPVPSTTTSTTTTPPPTRTTAQQHPEHTNDPHPITEEDKEKTYIWAVVCILAILSCVLLIFVIIRACKNRFTPKRSISCTTIQSSRRKASCPPSYDEAIQNHHNEIYNGEKGEKKMQFHNAECKTVAPISTAWSSEK